MKRAMSFTILLFSLMLCGCETAPEQEKAEITPYAQRENISYKKEALGMGDMELSFPWGIASYGDMLYISDMNNSRVIKYDIVSNSAEVFGEFSEPTLVDASELLVCVYDKGEDIIRAMTHDGKVSFEFSLADEFDFVYALEDIEVCGDGSLFFSMTAFDKNIDRSGIYRISDGRLSRISAYTVGAFASAGDTVYFVSKYELKEDNSWMTGYAELLEINGGEYERVSAFSDGFSATGLEYVGDKLFVYDDCSQSVVILDANAGYIETVFSESVVNDFVYKGFCGDKYGNFYISDGKGNTIYRLVKND